MVKIETLKENLNLIKGKVSKTRESLKKDEISKDTPTKLRVLRKKLKRTQRKIRFLDGRKLKVKQGTTEKGK